MQILLEKQGEGLGSARTICSMGEGREADVEQDRPQYLFPVKQ
jgi:hypothetical protein